MNQPTLSPLHASRPATDRPRRARARATRYLAVAGVFVAAACGGDDGDTAPPAKPPETTPATSTADGGATAGSGSDGFEIEMVGWSRAPYPNGADSVAYAAGGNDYVAVHIQACLDADTDVMPHLLGVVTVGDADGEPFNTGIFQEGPIVSPSGFQPPEPGECTQGWVYPTFEPGLEPVTAVWLDAAGTHGGNQTWPLGEPYPAGPLPLFGDVLTAGDAWDVADGASWTVHDVSVAGPDDPLAPPRELDPGMAWVVIDAVYCEGSAPGTIHERLGVVVDGWAARGTPLTVETAIEPTGDDGCHHRPVAVAMPVGMSVTAVTGTDHTGPWWPIDPPVEITD